MSRVQRLGSGHLGVCTGRRVISTHCTRDAARKAQRRYNHRWFS